MLGPRERLLELLVLTLPQAHLVDATQDEGSLVEALVGTAAHLADALELCGGGPGVGKAVLVGRERYGCGLARPGVQELDVRGDLHQALVLVLAAEVYRRAHALGQLAHGGHAPIDLDAPAAFGLDPASHHHALGIRRGEEDAALDNQPIGTLSHGTRVRALAHQELYGREERGLARPRLPRQHGESWRGGYGRVTDEGDVLHVQLVDHG